jgi:SAM-dependent methyltransferase
MDILEYNRAAWEKEVAEGNKWTVPVSPEEVAKARDGVATLLLTPTKPTPMEWFGELKGKKVLCLASGGGQQGPLLAAMGAVVTVFDNCPAQLEKDRFVAKREGFSIALEQGDMRDLSRFPDETFDLVFHPVSNIFVDDVLTVWKEAHRVLKKGGRLLSGVANPVLFIFDLNLWDKTKEMKVRYRIPYSDLESLPKDELDERLKQGEPIEWGHSLQDLIGGQIAAGFLIAGFFEDNSGWGDLLDPYIDTFLATLAVKPL